MNLMNENGAGSLVGCAAFGTPAGREIAAQTGVSVALNEDWVAHTSSAMLFDPEMDTIVLRRVKVQAGTVLWFGTFRQAFEMNFNRDGGYCGFCVWTVNHSVDGAKLLCALKLAAQEVRSLAVTGGKFHSGIHEIARQLNGDPASYAEMLASAQALPLELAEQVPLNQPNMVLDLQGCSDEFHDHLVDLFQTEPVLQGLSALALARSAAVVESARRLREWTVVSPADFFMAPTRMLTQKLGGQLREARALAEERGQEAAKLGQRLLDEKASYAGRVQTLDQQIAQFREGMSEIKRQAQAAAERAAAESTTWSNRTSRAEKQAQDMAQEASRLRSQLEDPRRVVVQTPPPAPWPRAPDQSGEIRSLKERLQNAVTKHNEGADAYLRLETEKIELESKVKRLESELQNLPAPANQASSTSEAAGRHDSDFDSELPGSASHASATGGGARERALHWIGRAGWPAFFISLLVHFSGAPAEKKQDKDPASQMSPEQLNLQEQVTAIRRQRDSAEARAMELAGELRQLQEAALRTAAIATELAKREAASRRNQRPTKVSDGKAAQKEVDTKARNPVAGESAGKMDDGASKQKSDDAVKE